MHLIWFYSKKSLFKLNKFDYYKRSFSLLKEKWVTIIYFYEEDTSIELGQNIIDGIKNMGVELIWFSHESEIISYIQWLSWKIFINTFEEQEIIFVNTIRKLLWQKITDNPEIFFNKYLQRSIIGEKYPETIVKYKKFSIEEAMVLKEDDLTFFPCIIKPTGWVQSSWVSKIHNFEEYQNSLTTILNAFKMLENKKLSNQSVLIEEFIDGKMYTIDYYVDEEQNITLSKPVFVKLWVDYGINDFCNISRFISHTVESEIDWEQLRVFIQKTVTWGNIKNTFVHHEFKITSQWIYKTIEINWRIWWFRLDMYQMWYDIDLLTFPFMPIKEDIYPLQKNIAMFAFYPKKSAIFNGYNEDIISAIEALPSFHRINRGIKPLGAEIWLTKDWYGKVWSLELANNNIEEFTKDVEYIEHIYFNIIKTD